MKGSAAPRGTHGLRKRCPICRKLRKFCVPNALRPQWRGWTKERGRWVCPLCSVQLEGQRLGPVTGLDRLVEKP